MRRRDFITLLGGAATGWPVTARAQQAAMPVIGVLGSGSPDRFGDLVRAFRQGLGETGRGQQRAIEYRWAHDQYDQLPALAADLVRRQVAVSATLGSLPAVPIAKSATTTMAAVPAVR
jgi:putative ABC transport system substrate-binding protein